MFNMAKPIASVRFVDGSIRDVFRDFDERQFVRDDDGTPVYGNWIDINDSEILAKGECMLRPSESVRVACGECQVAFDITVAPRDEWRELPNSKVEPDLDCHFMDG